MKHHSRIAGITGLLLAGTIALAGCSVGTPEKMASPSASTSSSASGGTGGPLTLTDGVGRTVELEAPVTRAVVASRYNNELIRAMGNIDNVIGVDGNTAQDRVYWSQFDPGKTIGKGQNDLNYEQIIDLAPEVLITPKNSTYETDIAKLEPAGIKVIVVTGWDAADFDTQLKVLGTAFGNQEGAQRVADFYHRNMDEVRRRVSSVTDKKTVYWEYGEPFTTAIPGTSNDGWNTMLLDAGAINIFGDPSISTDTIDPEKILREDPDLIMKTTSGPAFKNTAVYTPPTGQEFKGIADEMVGRPGWSDLTAVKDGNLYLTTGFATGGLGKMVGTLYTASWLYPDEMEGLDPDAVFAEWMGMQGQKPIEGHVLRVTS